MDKRREELEEQKADLHLALLMDEYAERMGKQVREEAEAAFEKGELEMPPELDAKCRALISDAPVADGKKKPMRAAMRYALVAALSIVLMLGTLIAVQAAGIDVFGSIATWTNSVFHFQNNIEGAPKVPNTEPENPIQTALLEVDMPVDFAPVWFPDGYSVVDIQKNATDNMKIIAASAEKEGKPTIHIIIKENTRPYDTRWEKDIENARQIVTNELCFYLFANEGMWNGLWSDGVYTIHIFNVETEEDLVQILRSIGGNGYD